MPARPASRGVVLVMVALWAPTLAGCISETDPAASPETLDWALGASWTYQYRDQHERIVEQAGETKTTRTSANDTVHMTVIDRGRVPGWGEAFALLIDGESGVHPAYGDPLRTGAYILDARTQAPIAGPSGRLGWDPFCSLTMEGAVPPFWPVRLPLEEHAERTHLLDSGRYHVQVGGVETVQTLAGRFAATRIDVTVEPRFATNVERQVTYWYADDVGNIVLVELDEMSHHTGMHTNSTSYRHTMLELESYSPFPKPGAERNVPVLKETERRHLREYAIDEWPRGVLHARIVSDQPDVVALDEAHRVRFALEKYLRSETSVDPHSSVHNDVYHLTQADWGKTEITWHTREGDRPWREVGSGPGITTTTTNVTTLRVRADLALGDDLPCLNGSSRREQRAYESRFIVFEWADAFEVPPGPPTQMPVVDLPAKAGNVDVRLNWTVTPPPAWLQEESGRPVADCQQCAAEGSRRGHAEWLVWEDTPFPVYWDPTRALSPQFDAPVTQGQTVYLQVVMSPFHTPF